MQRDTEKGKPRFDLMLAEGVPYEEQMITRFAALLGRGAEKYDDRNWEKADSEAEMARMKSSAFRHFMQWMCGETDEDHAAGAIFNILAFETTKYKVDQDADGSVKMAPPGDLRNLPEGWQNVGYASEDSSDSVRMFVGGVYGPPPPASSAIVDSFVHPDEKVTSVSNPSEMVKKPVMTSEEAIAEYVGMGYSQEEARKIFTERLAPKEEQVKEQVQAHLNLRLDYQPVFQGSSGVEMARQIEDQIVASRRARLPRLGW